MRVTKTIREYVERQVHLKMEQCTPLTELKRKANDAQQKYEYDIKAMREECNKKLLDICTKYGIDSKHADRFSVSDYARHDLPEVQEYARVQNELYKKRDCAIMDILATMELGGTKAELMEMINNLKF